MEAFMKAHTELRVGSDAIACLIDRLTALAETVVKAAEVNAKKENRPTILAADVALAMASATGSTSDLPFLFKQLEALPAKDTADLSALIQKWVDSH